MRSMVLNNIHHESEETVNKSEFVGLKMTPEVRQQIKGMTQRERRNESDMIRIALEDWLNWRNEQKARLTTAANG
jgi:Arc/MetJ-type ribon-helix-helix transcriptional regulator